MTDDLKEILDDIHFAAMAHAVAADTDDDGGTSAVWSSSSGTLRTRSTLTAERLSTASVSESKQRSASIQHMALMTICSPRTTWHRPAGKTDQQQGAVV